MKGILITPKGEISVQDYESPLFETVGKSVGGWIEHVCPRGLAVPWCMIVNEEGALTPLPVNMVGTVLYNAPKPIENDKHWYKKQPIVPDNYIHGDIVIMQDGFANGEPDIVGIPEDQLKDKYNWFRNQFDLKGEDL